MVTTDGFCIPGVSVTAGGGDSILSADWLETVQAALELTKDKPKSGHEKVSSLTTDYMLATMRARFSELASSTQAVADAAVTSETEAKARVTFKTDKNGMSRMKTSVV